MSEQTDRIDKRDSGDGTPLWNSWAWGMMTGLIVLLLGSYGMYRVKLVGDDWAHISQSFDRACQSRQFWLNERDSMLRDNNQARALFPRLAHHPHPYPIPQSIWTNAEKPERFSPHIPGPRDLRDLTQAPIALNEHREIPYHYTCHQSVRPLENE